MKPNKVEVDDYGLTTVELGSLAYRPNDEWVLASRVAQVAYYPMPKGSKKHVVVSGKQRIVGADGVQDPEQYNNYAEFSLFTDLPKKIKAVEKRVMKADMKPWARQNGEKKTVVAPAPK